MVLALLVLLLLALVQGAVAVHARNLMIDAASAGARHGALADRTAADGVAMGTRVTAEERSDGGAPVLRITVTGSMPVFGLWASPIEWRVHGHAFRY